MSNNLCRATIDADGWMHSGDVGFLDADGYLRLTDRLKDMYIVGGFNVYPAEIEKQMLGLPGIYQIGHRRRVGSAIG